MSALSPVPLQNYQRDQVNCRCSKSVPAQTTIQTMPRFLSHAFFNANLFPLAPDGSLNHRSVTRYRQKALADIERATPYVVDYANSFRLDRAER
jgi:hypothetical protein